MQKIYGIRTPTDQPPTTTSLEAALNYAAAGIPIFPVSANKVPLCGDGGFYNATTDPDTIVGWFTKYPYADIAMPTGEKSGYIVVDLDMKNGKNGFRAVPDYMSLSPVMASSPTGGAHTFHAYKEGIPNQIDQFAPGVEIKSDGAYVVLPSPGSGREWIMGSIPAESLPPVPGHLVVPGGPPKREPAPEWLRDIMERRPELAGVGVSTDAADYPPPLTREAVELALETIPNVDMDRLTWIKISISTFVASEGAVWGCDAFERFSKKSPKHATKQRNGSTPRETWRGHEKTESRYGRRHWRSGVGTLFWYASKADPNWRDGLDQQAATQTDEPSVDVATQTDETKASTLNEWPTMGEAAYYGIIGEVVKTIEPESESDPVAILIQLIVAVGSMIGRQAYYQVESDKHHPNMFAAAVGDTSKARKGTSWGRVKDVAYHADQEWVLRHIGSGLSSGEGLIHQVRDPVIKIKDGKEEIVDAGVSDKRFMAIEAELSGLLKAMERPGNTISPLFRKAWDGGDLQTLTRNNALRATSPHVSMVGHITIEELRSCLRHTDAANGFANRILFFLARRSKELPMGGSLDEKVVIGLGKRIGTVINKIGFRGDNIRVRFSPNGEARWRKVYGRLTKGHPGLFGAVTARGEAQVIRVALIYAIMDENDFIDLPHIEAGLAVWDYCERSAMHIFGEMLGDPVADTILVGLKQAFPAGMSRTEIYRELFGGNGRSNAIAAALARLKALGLAKSDVVKVGPGVLAKPTEVWTYTPRT